MLSVHMEEFKIGDLVKYIYYDVDDMSTEHTNIAFVLDIVEDPDEKQMDLFPKILIYDTHLRQTVLTHYYNIEFISRAT
jgi:tagatose-1,6-bisphosphate aldolase